MSDIRKYLDGIARFQKHYFGENPKLADTLGKKQKPQVLLIGCSDSRVDPALLTDCAPGDLFMIRNIANLVPPYQASSDLHGVSSALEYAVCHLEVDDIIVLGHYNCGGIGALLESTHGEETGEFIGRWINIAAPARDKVLRELPNESQEKQARACEKEAILVSLKNLMTFPWIKDRVTKGNLSLHGWYYNITTGQLRCYNQQSDEFEILVKRYTSKLLGVRKKGP